LQLSIDSEMGNQQWKIDIGNLNSLFIRKKIDMFLEACGERGIEVAQANGGEYGQFISFSKTIDDKILTVEAKEITTIPRTWIYDGQYKTENVSPLMLAEYGSGNFFTNEWNDGVTRETSIYESGNDMPHANDAVWWWTEELGGERHYSSGESPTMPMYTSFTTLMQEITSIALSIF